MPSAGRLTLTWAHKNDALISTPIGGYEWVDRDDPRANEVRLLEEVDRVGEVTGEASDNLLIRGDGLDALRALVKHPDYASEYRGKVKLVYIDPPFNTGQAFEHYDDGFEHSIWLGMMRERLDLIADLLAPDGSVWVHLDDAELHYCKVLMDEVFGRSNFISTVVWQRTTSSRNDSLTFSASQDSILVYARDAQRFAFNRLKRPESADAAYKNPDNDPRGPWREIDYKVAKTADERPNLYYPIVHPRTGEEVWPRRERVWAYGRDTHKTHLDDDLLFWGLTGNYTFPKLKKFLSSAGDSVVPDTLWLADDVDTTRRAKAHIKELFVGQTPFATPKPERLLERIVHITTNPGDIVVDVFAGSGTTAAVAHKMRRRWVTAEVLEATVSRFTAPRLRRVVEGSDGGGITAALDWQGGGGFRELRVSSPVFEVAEIGGMTLTAIADGVDTDRLAASVAAQLGFARHTDDELPFAGRKGRTRLAVIRGVLDVEVASALLAGIDDGETLLVAATAVDDDARAHLREHSRGSRVVRIPSGLFPKGGVK